MRFWPAEGKETRLSRKKKRLAEFRYYRMPEGRCVLALLGEKWVQNYGRDVDYLHFHNYLEIGYCYAGKGTVTLGEEKFRFSGGELTVIPSNYLHTTVSDPGDVSRWEYLFVDVEGLLKKMQPSNAGQREQMIKRINSRALFLENKRRTDLALCVKKVLDIMRETSEFYQEEAEGLLLAVFSEIARENREVFETYEENPGEGKIINNIISYSLDYISDHYDEPIKVSDVAKRMHISETHFRRVFSAHMHMTPLEYINLVRIRAACEYLKKTDEGVAIIANKCGFTTNSTFNRNFRQITGVSPAEWRKRPENYEQQILRFTIHSEEGW